MCAAPTMCVQVLHHTLVNSSQRDRRRVLCVFRTSSGIQNAHQLSIVLDTTDLLCRVCLAGALVAVWDG